MRNRIITRGKYDPTDYTVRMYKYMMLYTYDFWGRAFRIKNVGSPRSNLILKKIKNNNIRGYYYNADHAIRKTQSPTAAVHAIYIPLIKIKICKSYTV